MAAAVRGAGGPWEIERSFFKMLSLLHGIFSGSIVVFCFCVNSLGGCLFFFFFLLMLLYAIASIIATCLLYEIARSIAGA